MSFLSTRWLKIVLVGAGLLIAAVSFFWIDATTSLFSKSPDYAQEQDSVFVHREVITPVFLFGMVVNDMQVVEDEVKRNQRFQDLFKDAFVAPQVIQQLNTITRNTFDFRKIAAHKKYTLITEKDSLNTARALIYEPNAIDYVIFHLKDSLIIETCQREVVKRERSIAGVIQSNLSETINEMDISHELTNKFVDIFAWVVDFQRLQKGDEFRLIYEESLVEGKPIGVGNILGVEFIHAGNPFFAFPFDQGDGIDYFDEEGNSLRKALLKYPIEFTRISSRYSMSRFHPVVKVFRPHLGTDFAAPTGTPIRSVGDGIVEEAQYKSNNGNYVKIRHNGTYTTGYLHMSKIAAGITPGTRVRQAQTIGYVGSTGLATGPHLCYRFWKNGVQVDALKVELPPSLPVKKEYWEEFEKTKSDISNRLKTIIAPHMELPEVVSAH